MPLAVTVCQCQDHPLTDPCRHILSVSPYDVFRGRSYLLHYVVSSIVPCRTQFIVFPLSVTKGTRYANTSSLYRDPHPSLYRVFGWKAVGAEQSRPAPADVWMRSDESRAAPVGIFPRDVGLLHPSKFEGRSGSSRGSVSSSLRPSSSVTQVHSWARSSFGGSDTRGTVPSFPGRPLPDSMVGGGELPRATWPRRQMLG